MTATWSQEQLKQIDAARELRIAAARADGTYRRWTPIWVVCVDGHVYVRSWHRRDTGWFGDATRSRRARIRVPTLDADVAIDDVGDGITELRDSIDTAYRTKYGDTESSSMTNDTAATTTLRLNLQPPAHPNHQHPGHSGDPTGRR